MKYLFTLSIPLLLLSFEVFGHLDNTFNGNGKYIFVSENQHVLNQMKIQHDGKIISTGYYTSDSISVIRINSNGSLDNTFNLIGYHFIKQNESLRESGKCIAFQNVDKILIGIRYRIDNTIRPAILRLNQSGTTDETFGNNGYSTFPSPISEEYWPKRISVNSDNKIIVLTDFNLFQLTENGFEDNTFGIGGILDFNISNATFYDMTIQTDGKILIAGEANGNSIIIRINANGTFDNTFGSNGVKTINVNNEPNDRAVGVVQLGNGNILVGGYYSNHIYLMQLNSTNGDLVTTYGTEGIVAYSYPNATNSIANAIAEDPTSNDILIAGTALYGAKSYFALSRVSSTGIVEAYAAIDMGGDLAEAKSLVIQPDRKIVIAGTASIDNTYHMAVARLVPDFTTLIQGIESSETIIGNINLFPNPASHYVNIHSQYRLEHVKVLDAIGNEVMQENLNGNTKLDISRLSKGLYHFIIQTEQGTVTKKVSVW